MEEFRCFLENEWAEGYTFVSFRHIVILGKLSFLIFPEPNRGATTERALLGGRRDILASRASVRTAAVACCLAGRRSPVSCEEQGAFEHP